MNLSMQEESGTPRPRVVLDSNVIISGFHSPGGTPRRILDALRNGEIAVVISPFLFAEVAKSLGEDFDWGEPGIQEAMVLLRENCILIQPVQEASVSELSEADNRILDCAVQGQVHYLVTGDRGFQRLQEFQGIRIVSPREFLVILCGSSQYSPP